MGGAARRPYRPGPVSARTHARGVIGLAGVAAAAMGVQNGWWHPMLTGAVPPDVLVLTEESRWEGDGVDQVRRVLRELGRPRVVEYASTGPTTCSMSRSSPRGTRDRRAAGSTSSTIGSPTHPTRERWHSVAFSPPGSWRPGLRSTGGGGPDGRHSEIGEPRLPYGARDELISALPAGRFAGMSSIPAPLLPETRRAGPPVGHRSGSGPGTIGGRCRGAGRPSCLAGRVGHSGRSGARRRCPVPHRFDHQDVPGGAGASPARRGDSR